jgi:ubiquinone/menaquinone biosynthesis C-methylase UbiE
VSSSSYTASSLSHAAPTELDRLEIMQRALDPASTAALDSLDIKPDWRCLELGGGAGSIATWLAGQVTHGTVTVTDIDTRFLPHGQPRLQVLRHDLNNDEFPPASFDLIHARLVLEHIREAESLIPKIANWLAPGGWFVAEGLNPCLGESSPNPPLRNTTRAMARLLKQQIGTDPTLGRRLPHLFARAGLIDIRATFATLAVGSGGIEDALFLATLDQISPAALADNLLTHEDLKAVRAWLKEPEGTDAVFLSTCVHGRRTAGKS